jgi:hypothetical protein
MIVHRPMGRSSTVSRHEISLPRQEFNVVFEARRTARGGRPCRSALIQAAPNVYVLGKSMTLSARRGGGDG